VRSESVTYVGHATVLIDVAGARLLSDPVLRGRIGHLRRHAPPVARGDYDALDGVLISHLHLDHLDLPSMRRLPRHIPVVVPRGGGRLLRRRGFTRVEEVVAGDSTMLAGAAITAVPAEHAGRRRPGPGATDAAALGFVVAGRSRVYFAGDTDVYPGMAAMAPLDVALLPVWGWGPTLGPGHMDPAAAARALLMLQPRLAVPIHWGTLFPIGLARVCGRHLTDPPRDFAREAARVAPAVQVRVLMPGSPLALHEAPA
jgi:L-ascorbate metabolism protein UlaG (beta-lactamase superfamily)